MRCLLRHLMTALVGLLFASFALAHKSSDAYLQMQRTESGVSLRVDVALRDLDLPLDLDSNGDAELTWGEIKAAWPAIEGYVIGRLQLQGCVLRAERNGLERRSDGAYAVLWLVSNCRPEQAPALQYTLLREVDPTHRGLLKVEWGSAPLALRVLDPSRPAGFGSPLGTAAAESPAQARPDSPAPATAGLAPAGATAAADAVPKGETSAPSFLGEGIHHIVTGYDHVLFLMCLLLPSVMRRSDQGWRPVDGLMQAVLPVAGIVTAFTLAHSITLGLAAMKWVSLPASFIEPAIAVTIILAALDNLYPVFRGRRVAVTFLFGLIHGFGFAGVLAELNLPKADFAWALLQFNVGLELGQLAIVLAAAGALFLLRRRPHYPGWAIRGGSFAAIVVGVLWFIERTADVTLLAWQ